MEDEMLYGLVEKKIGKLYSYQTPQMPKLKGIGSTPDEAFASLVKKMEKEMDIIS